MLEWLLEAARVFRLSKYSSYRAHRCTVNTVGGGHGSANLVVGFCCVVWSDWIEFLTRFRGCFRELDGSGRLFVGVWGVLDVGHFGMLVTYGVVHK